MNLKSIFSSINNLIAPMQLIVTASLLYQLYDFKSNNIFSDPTKSKAKLEEVKKDTIIKINTPPLETKGEFVYFDGKFEGEQFRISDSYSYTPKYPPEIFDGYIIAAKNNNGDTFYVWSKNKRESLKDLRIKGWFFTDNLSRFQVNKTDVYAAILYPIVEKQKPQDSVNKLIVP